MCACVEQTWHGIGLHNSLAESSTAPALLSPDTWGDPELGIDTCWLRLFYHLGAALPSRNKGDSCLCLFMYRDIDVMQCPILGSSVFPRVEKCLLCGREYFLQTSPEFPHFTLLGISIRK